MFCLIAAALYCSIVIGQGMTHHHVWWGIKSFDQYADFLVNAEVERSYDLLHAPGTQPVFSSFKQGLENSMVIRGFNQPEKPRFAVVLLLV